jgi:hypothetical protein
MIPETDILFAMFKVVCLSGAFALVIWQLARLIHKARTMD